jgi:hypothetical protein
LQVRADGRVELPGYVRKNRLVGKDLRRSDANLRESNRIRQQRHREKKKQHHNAPDVTPRDRPVTSNGSNAPTGTGTGTYRPIPGPAAGSLASASGRLAIRPENGTTASSNGTGRREAAGRKAREAKSPAELRADVRFLADKGMSAPDITHALARHGVKEGDVERWLAEPAEGAPP